MAENVTSSNTFSRYIKSQVQTFRQEMDAMSILFIIAVYLFFGIFLVVPLTTIVVDAFIVDGMPSLDYFIGENIGIFLNEEYFTLDLSKIRMEFIHVDDASGITMIGSFHWCTFWNTIFVALGTTTLSVIIGTMLAYVMVRYEFIGKRFVRVLVLIPLIIPPFVSGVGIKKILFSQYSTLNNLFWAGAENPLIGLWTNAIVVEGLTAVVLVQSLHFYTFIYLNASAAFANIDPTMEEQGENLGANHKYLLRTVTLPLALPGIAAGAILTFILSVEDIGTPMIFANTGLPSNQVDKLLTFEVFNGITQLNGDISSQGLALSVILLVTASAGFLAIRKYVGLRQYSMISKGGLVNPRIYQAGKKGGIIFYLLFIPLIVIALTPHLGILLFAFSRVWNQDEILPKEFGLNNFIGNPNAILENELLSNAVYNTLILSGIAVILIIIFGVFAAYVLSRKKFFSKSVMDILVTIPIAVPGIVLGVGYFKLFANSAETLPFDLFDPLVNPLPLLVMSFTIRRFPFTVRAAYAGLQQTDVALEEASWNLGASKPRTLTKITLPLIALNVFAGALMSFVYCTSEVSTSLTLIGRGGNEFGTIPTMIAEKFSAKGDGPQLASALGFILMMMQIMAITISEKILKGRSDAITGI